MLIRAEQHSCVDQPLQLRAHTSSELRPYGPETEPRWHKAIALSGTTFDLVDSWDQLKLPPTVSGKTLGAYLRRLPYWQDLVKEYQARGEWLRPYSFRDTFSVRAHSFNISDTNIAQAMGHTVEIHHRSYRTSEWKAVRSASAQAS